MFNKENNEIEISIKTDPVKGKANREIIKKVSKYFNVNKSNIEIIHGLYSKTKVIKISV